MPVGTDTAGLSDVFAWRGPAGDGVEVPGFGEAATTSGFDLLSPGNAEPVAGAAAGGEFAGLDPVGGADAEHRVAQESNNPAPLNPGHTNLHSFRAD